MNHPTSRKHPQFLDLAVTVGVAIRKRESQSKGMTRSPAMREFLKFTYGVKDRTSWFSLVFSWFDTFSNACFCFLQRWPTLARTLVALL